MQQNVSPDAPPPQSSTSEASTQASLKYSEEQYSNVVAFLNVQAQTAQLLKTVETAKSLQQQQLEQPKMAGAPKLGAPPKTATMSSLKQTTQAVSTAAAEKTPEQQTNATKVADLLKQLLQAKSDDEIVSILTQLTTLMEGTEPPLDLSSADQTTILNAFSAITGGEEYNIPFSNGLVNYLLTTMVSNGATKDQIMAKLKELANAQPPNLFTAGAKNLLSTLSTTKMQNYYFAMLQNPNAQQDALNDIKSYNSEMFNPDSMLQSGFATIANAFIKANSTDNKDIEPMMTLEVSTDTGNSATTTLVKTEMTFLAMLLSILEQYAPNNPQVQKYAQQLSAMMKEDPSELTPDQINQLNDMVNNIGSLESALVDQGIMPASANVLFLQQLYSMFKKLVDDTDGEIQSYTELLTQVKAALDQITPLADDFSTVQGLLNQLLNGQPLTDEQTKELTKALGDLMEQYPNLAPEDQTQVAELFSQLGDMDMGGVTGSQLVGSMLLKLLMEKYPDLSPQQLMDIITKNYSGAATSNADMDNIVLTMTNAVSDSAFPNAKPFSGASFTYNSSNYWTMMSTVYSGAAASNTDTLQAAENTATTDATYYSDMVTQLSAQATGIQTTLDQLNTLQPELEQGEANSHNKYYASSSIANQFYDAILNHFMPGQDAILAEIAAMLFIYNFGSDTFSTLEKDMAGFDNAGTNYTFGTNISGQNSGADSWHFTGSATAAQDQLDAEKGQVDNDIAKTQTAEGDIGTAQTELAQKQADLETAHNNGEISDKDYEEQKTAYDKMGTQLTNDLASLKEVETNLNDLKTQLNAVVITSSGTNSYYIGSGSISAIEAAENKVVNGDPNSANSDTGMFAGEGGLATTYGDISKNQSSYSSLSTTQATSLSETMTAVQQEWSIVSSALQTLNEVYLTFAQNISSG